MMDVSPLAPSSFPKMPAIDGVELSTAETHIKYQGRDDVLLALFPDGASVAGVFTKSHTESASVSWCRKILPTGKANALVVAAGNANTFNGVCGEQTVNNVVKKCVEKLQCRGATIYVSFTGVIGELFPVEKVTNHLPQMIDSTKNTIWKEAAKAIHTTDTFAKGVTRTAKIGDTEITINGIIKGSGMVAPNMATMLGYIFTDAALPSEILQDLFLPMVARSFNSITVDSDRSTSDTVLLFATHKANHAEISSALDPELDAFKQVLQEVCIEMAQLVVKDGEGATKFVTVNVNGAASEEDARSIGLTIANSPLVKTAIAGEDANWGRIVMAIGKADAPVNVGALSVSIGDELVCTKGELNPEYSEEKATSHMQGQNVDITIDVGVGAGSATVWTCDLTHGYITINADYRS